MARPRFATARDPDWPTRGHLVAAAADALRRPLFAHQRAIADTFGEYDPATGLPRYQEGIVVMPRRGGKTGLVLPWLVAGLRSSATWRGFYTEKSAEDATKVLRDEWAPLVQASSLAKFLRFRYARGDAGVYAVVGGRRLSRVEIFPPTANAVHGRDADAVACDECWAHSAARGADIDAGIRPARWSRPGAQVLYVSAGGTETSGWLNGMVDRGRAGTPGVAFWEWSADAEADGYDPYDEDLWNDVHPGLESGLVSIAQLRHDARTLDRKTWERSALCVWDRAAGTALLGGWEDLFRPTAKPSGPLVLAYDVHPSRTSAAIVVAGAGAAELIEHRAGVAWVAPRLAELLEVHDEIVAVVRDPSGPAGATRLDDVTVTDVGPAEVAEACADLIDAIANPGPLRVRPHPALAAAFVGARTYNRGDGRTVWARRTSNADLTPLYALTLAAWASATLPVAAIY